MPSLIVVNCVVSSLVLPDWSMPLDFDCGGSEGYSAGDCEVQACIWLGKIAFPL